MPGRGAADRLADRGDELDVHTAHLVTHPGDRVHRPPPPPRGFGGCKEIDYFAAPNPGIKDGDIQGGERLEGAALLLRRLQQGRRRLEVIQSTGYVRLFAAIWRPDFSGESKFTPEPLRGMRPARE